PRVSFRSFEALFRSPGIHKRLKVDRLLQALPGIKSEGIRAGFSYYDASMWDDVLVLENMRSAHRLGVASANYLKGTRALWENGRVVGMECEDQETFEKINVRSKAVIFCGGPWTDLLGERVTEGSHAAWKPWLKPSRGVHLVFRREDFPVEGALLMTHPEDGRISFVMPRNDLGAGVTIVGTTDGPSPRDPAQVRAESDDRAYLLDLLKRYFPKTAPTAAQIMSEYVGVRPLVGLGDEAGESLSQVSREHHIDRGPGGSVWIAGGKYTTHRAMAEEIVDFAVRAWEEDYANDQAARVPPYRMSRTLGGFEATPIKRDADHELHRYGGDEPELFKLQNQFADLQALPDPEGFPKLSGQLAYALKYE
ncbi:MAG: FAD-dependent oxidoreductase, partial [Verrucomicrobiaceae bacterium]